MCIRDRSAVPSRDLEIASVKQRLVITKERYDAAVVLELAGDLPSVVAAPAQARNFMPIFLGMNNGYCSPANTGNVCITCRTSSAVMARSMSSRDLGIPLGMARGCSWDSPARSRGGAMESSFAITKRRLTLAIYYVSEGT